MERLGERSVGKGLVGFNERRRSKLEDRRYFTENHDTAICKIFVTLC